MSDFKHTAEPWHECASGNCQCGQILGPSSEYICTVTSPYARRRILACVNACAGVRTETLELVPLNLSTKNMVERIESAEMQRDQLLAALERIADWPREFEVCEIAREAIAAVKGVQSCAT